MARFANVQLAAPPPVTLYFAVRVVLPGFRPLRTVVALARCCADPAWIIAFASLATIVLAPLPAKDMKQDVDAELPSADEATEKSNRPEAGTVAVIVGPTVARSV